MALLDNFNNRSRDKDKKKNLSGVFGANDSSSNSAAQNLFAFVPRALERQREIERQEAEEEDRRLFEETDPRQGMGAAGAFSTMGETQRRRMRNMQKSLLNSTSTIPSLLGDQ